MEKFIEELEQAGIPFPPVVVNLNEPGAPLPDNGQRGRFFELLAGCTTVISSPEEDAIRQQIAADMATGDPAVIFAHTIDVTDLPESEQM